jgi:hypothetical protein
LGNFFVELTENIFDNIQSKFVNFPQVFDFFQELDKQSGSQRNRVNDLIDLFQLVRVALAVLQNAPNLLNDMFQNGFQASATYLNSNRLLTLYLI